MSTVVLLGRKADPHIIGVCKELSKINTNYIVLDTINFRDSILVEFDGNTINSYLNIGSKRVQLGQISSIWNYAPLNVLLKGKIIQRSLEFIRAEWNEGISSLWNSISPHWINHPYANQITLNRLYQLRNAKQVGLNTPVTLVTNDPDSFRRFYERYNGNLVAKTLHSSRGLPKGKMIYTTKIEYKDMKYAENLKYAPCMFQEYVPKKTEYRVTIIGTKFHVAEIHSQSSKRTRVDWRRYDDFKKTPYLKSKLPEAISNKLLKLMKRIRLEFAAVDLIRTPSDEIFFLELNTSGRWWWIQELTGMNIAKDIAYCLSQNK